MYHDNLIPTIYGHTDVKAFCANLNFVGLVAILAMTEVVPYELTWLAVFWVPDALRKLFKLNTEAVGLVLRELDYWVPFVTLCFASFFGSASFGHDGAAVLYMFAYVFTFTVNILLGKLVRPASIRTHKEHFETWLVPTLTPLSHPQRMPT